MDTVSYGRDDEGISLNTVKEKVNAKAGLSPGMHTLSYAEKCQRTRKHVDEKMKLPSSKRRRLELKQERAVNQGAQEVLQGVSYQSGVGPDCEADIEAIPSPVAKGEFKPVYLKQPAFVTFDLETTDLMRGQHLPQITQIAATDLNGSRKFSQYVLPTVQIAPGARQVTGLTVRGGILLRKGQPVEATDIKTALERFCAWLNKMHNTVLIAHNGRKFDFPILVHHLKSTGTYDKFTEFCKGFVDSLEVFRKVLPDRESYKQVDLVNEIMNTAYGAHDAVEDAVALGKLVKYLEIQPNNVLNHSFSVNSIYNNMS
ncbi:uncharacterized protein LOC132751224 [Ruditapes philippinarum]|uniref:uncharacterized protein LOC132751224 n=1 Tax=Ruditapes philippinarum TaxID=129788 RepID=UPI00295A9028|nr:uncharacterized protein LOC132751224 [Ruditapes philippinarum]